ncbi:hypothetical protein [Streptomyces sp. NPDC047046]|uniref:hypothetical protein n=1 Tax=Streptomyces sp. NPDC047046 TaxID=3155378 RepID=UPI0033D95A61
MSTEQPHDAEEPRTMHYTRSDPSKYPTTPEGQAAAAEGAAAHYAADSGTMRRAYSSVEISRLVRDSANPRTPIGQFQRGMLELVAALERNRVADRALAGDPNPTDADALEYVYEIADRYEQAQQDDAQRERFLDAITAELTPDDLRALRLAADVAVAVTPRVIVAEADDGKDPKQIAGEIGLSSARVYDLLRAERARRAALDTSPE